MGEDDPAPRKKAPKRGEDEVEARLAQLQAELEAESAKAKAAVAESKKGVATSAKRRPAKPAPEPEPEDEEPGPEAETEAEAEAEAEAETEEDGEAGASPPVDELAATEPAGTRRLSRPASELKAKAEAAAGAAATELAAETLAGKKPGEAALTVVKRRLPSLPTKEDFRNGALAVTGVAIGGWLAWGFIAPVFAFLWTMIKIGMLGGLAYGGYKIYGALPGKKSGEASPGGGDAEPQPEAEDEDEDQMTTAVRRGSRTRPKT